MADVKTQILRWGPPLAAGLLGVAVGVVGAFEHRATVTLSAVAWPSGLVLSLAGFAGLLLGLGELTGARAADGRSPGRLAALGAASAGWLVAILWLTYVGPPFSFAPKGDIILANDWRSMAFLLGGLVLGIAAVYRAWIAELAARLSSAASGPGRSKE
jgi:hypothetical protein